MEREDLLREGAGEGSGGRHHEVQGVRTGGLWQR